MFYLTFHLFGAVTTNEYETLCGALDAARHIMATWPKTLKSLVLTEGRYNNHRVICTFVKPLAP
jgi:hypothetical protein